MVQGPFMVVMTIIIALILARLPLCISTYSYDVP